MEILGKWLIAAAILCVIGFFSLKNEKDSSKVSLLILSFILGFIGYNCLSDKEQTYIEEGNRNGRSNGEGISFGSSHVVTLYSCRAFFANGGYACEVEVKSKNGILYAYPNGETKGYKVNDAPYDAPGACYIYWGSTPIYF